MTMLILQTLCLKAFQGLLSKKARKIDPIEIYWFLTIDKKYPYWGQLGKP